MKNLRTVLKDKVSKRQPTNAKMLEQAIKKSLGARNDN